MAKTSKYYFPNGKPYTGPIHKMGGKIHTGATHTSSSKVVAQKKPKKKLL